MAVPFSQVVLYPPPQASKSLHVDRLFLKKTKTGYLWFYKNFIKHKIAGFLPFLFNLNIFNIFYGYLLNAPTLSLNPHACRQAPL